MQNSHLSLVLRRLGVFRVRRRVDQRVHVEVEDVLELLADAVPHLGVLVGAVPDGEHVVLRTGRQEAAHHVGDLERLADDLEGVGIVLMP